MMVCTAQSISKMLGGNTVFEDITFEINEGDRVGIVGRNGSGKTTLFKLLAGHESPDEGEIHYKKGTTIGYLAQIPDYEGLSALDVLNEAFRELDELATRMKKLESEMASGADEKALKEYGHVLDEYTRRGGYETASKVQNVANGLGIQKLLETSFSALSGGEQTKVCLGLILLREPDLLLLDEPTNHLDIEAVEWLEEFLRGYKGTVLIVSHDRYFLDEVITKVMDLEDGELTVYIGSYSHFVKQKEELLLAEFAAFQEQQKKIKKMKEAIKRLKEWANQANPPNAALHKRARNMERALERMNKVKRPILERRKMGLEFDMSRRSGKDVITFENVTAGFREKPLLKNIDWNIRYQERTAIVGKNGSGKTTLLKVLLGQHEPENGKVVQGSSLKIGYLSQHVFEDLDGERVIDVYRETAKVAEGEARQELARFLFYGYSVFSKISSLSGGEKMRLRLAQLMSKDINLLVLDEPTNHLDIDSREVLEDAIDRFPGTIICVSHDRYLLNKCFPVTYWLEDGELHHYLEPYSLAREKHIESRIVDNSGDEVKEVPEPKKEKKEPTVSLEEKVERIEEELFNIEQELLTSSDQAVLESLYKKQEEVEEKRNHLYELLEGEIE
ncbi:ribosomal protection-like ABC-F family protein [Guptibacillus algicola]|uniref:ribosomal protection-like ABC-F family protein n=1 Tax=Guptibacillus algicola TaxID=225844 RepID=UPI001CD51F54|nr:ABC-F family ATP-binding cassette domain-containing protein [Alkalihalobacillus algicola]MCA0988738.1 ATP-binding cassette domain-containing protein [Alkalihalobacillus algicola]